MPLGDGTGPPGGSGPGTGRKRGSCGSSRKGKGTGSGSKLENLIGVISSVVALGTTIVKLFSSKKTKEKK